MPSRLLLFLSSCLLVFSSSCSSASPEEQAAQAACTYYQHLLRDGRVEKFLEGKAGADTLPDAYRQQLVMALQQYRNDMVRKHDGLDGVAVSANIGRTDTSLHVTYAFLLLSFCDSTQEEVSVPMVHEHGTWKLK